MEELVQDLTSALEESEQVKVEVEEESPIEEDLLRKRRIRKRRPPPCPSPNKLKELSSTNSGSLTPVNSSNGYRKIATQSGSDTENGFVLPAIIRKHRRRKIKHMEIDLLHKENKPSKQIEKKCKKMEIECVQLESTLQKNKLKCDEESGISASDDSNDDIDGQDGDDEMTDFYNEPGGSVCGIPCIIPWWEDEAVDDIKLKSIISGALPCLTESSQKGFHARVNRLPGMAARSIRRGRRRHKLKKTGEKMPCSAEMPRHGMKNYKRRKTENLLEDIAAEIGTSTSLPIPETNAGHQMLRSMGWKPGEGLGINGQGMHNPIIATKRNKRSGFGT
uniref:G patch domain-containing protein 2 n=1 Tax=Phallusia mammillata TaxID=59560 RepID=A0A6F9DD93_9ASCI|nr:G patch domain-containing protein 2 [Phallusia mammillata]